MGGYITGYVDTALLGGPNNNETALLGRAFHNIPHIPFQSRQMFTLKWQGWATE
jgi:hypothetical protein